MAAVPFAADAGEALLLGLMTGPVCLASCGPVVLPWMLVQPRGIGAGSRQLSIFLVARLAGYLMFATVAWLAGKSIPGTSSQRSWFFGGVQLLLAGALLVYAAGHSGDLVQIGEAPRMRHAGAVTLGFLTGLTLCPPFLVAGLRAAQSANLFTAVLFFLFFFAGTTVWFAPFLSLGAVRRSPALLTVARMVAVLLACWYAISGASTLIVRVVHG